jgi:hypothetical protein
MLTSNPNQKPNHRNPLFSKRLGRVFPLLVRIIAYFPYKARATLPHSFFVKKRVGNTPRPILRFYRFIPNRFLNLNPNTLRLLKMWWLAFLVSFLLTLQKILTTGGET